MTSFRTAIAAIESADGSLLWSVPDGWQQGRGAWGGLVVGAVVDAVQRRESSERPVRSVSLHLPAPAVVGPHRLEVDCLRAGSAMSTWTVQIIGAERVALGVVQTGAARADDIDPSWPHWQTADSDGGDWTQSPIVPLGAPIAPPFTEHLQFRPGAGLPASGESRVTGWVRFPDLDAWDAATLLAIADSWWPVALSRSPVARPMATVSFAANLLVDPASVDPQAPLFYEGTVAAAHAGYTSELRRLWAPDGQLVVENLQSIAVIK